MFRALRPPIRPGRVLAGPVLQDHALAQRRADSQYRLLGTEVDSRQVNLTRFNLFFPEQRAFFLQDTDIFEFGRIGGRNSDTNQSISRPSRENGRPFFSRRLGLSGSGQPVDLDYGGKLSGRIGPWSVGGRAVRQAEFGEVGSGDVFVGELR